MATMDGNASTCFLPLWRECWWNLPYSIGSKTHFPSILKAKVIAISLHQSGISGRNSPSPSPSIYSLLYFSPTLNLSPLSQLPGSPPLDVYLCVLRICVFPCIPEGVSVVVCEYSPVWHGLSTQRGPKGPCLFAKPERSVCVRRTTPHWNVWNYTQQGLAHPCLLSLALPVCHSFTAWD